MKPPSNSYQKDPCPTASIFSVGYRSIDGLSFDWNRYAIADEDTYIQYKSGIGWGNAVF